MATEKKNSYAYKRWRLYAYVQEGKQILIKINFYKG